MKFATIILAGLIVGYALAQADGATYSLPSRLRSRQVMRLPQNLQVRSYRVRQQERVLFIPRIGARAVYGVRGPCPGGICPVE